MKPQTEKDVRILPGHVEPPKVFAHGHAWRQPGNVIQCRFCHCVIGSSEAKQLCRNPALAREETDGQALL